MTTLTFVFILILVLLPVINANKAAGFRQIKCAANERMCALETGFCFCVPPHLVCDGNKACPDGSDEIDCTCDKETQFACKSGGCIPNDFVCNGVKECQDKSDEKDCECSCKEFQCSKKFQCIPAWKVCDGTRDCIDKTDEKDCETPACPPESQFIYDDDDRADGLLTVSVENDEENAHLFLAHGKNNDNHFVEIYPPGSLVIIEFAQPEDVFQLIFSVKEAKEIEVKFFDSANQLLFNNTRWVNAGVVPQEQQFPISGDITNNVKKITITSTQNAAKMLYGKIIVCTVCSDIQIPCRRGGCVDATKRCDGFFDCQDGSDEIDCVCDRKTQFACKQGGCYSKKLKCDGQWDCQDGDDEKNCKCDERAEFSCKSGGCIRKSRKCDMKPDCQDMSDEEDCEDVFRQSQIVTYLQKCPEEFPILHIYDRDIQYFNYRICNPGCSDARNMKDAYDIFSEKKQGLSFTDDVIAVELTFNPENGDVLPGFLVRKVCTTVKGAKSVSIFYQGEPILGNTFNIFRQVDVTKVDLRSQVCSSLYLIPQRVMVIMFTKAEKAAKMTIKGTFAEMCMRRV